MPRTSLPSILAAMLPIFGLASCGAPGGESAWGPPIELTPVAFGLGNPTAAADGLGNEYVAWIESPAATSTPRVPLDLMVRRRS